MSKQITLKAARVNAGLTQEEAANMLGISASTLIKWEKEPHKVQAYRQVEIASLYKLSVDDISFLLET